MKAPISIRICINEYRCGEEKTRKVLSGYLSPEEVSKIANKIPNLNVMAETKTDDLKRLFGFDGKTVKNIKKAIGDYLEKLAGYDFLTGMPDDVSPDERVRWGKLIDEAQIYGTSINKIKIILNSMDEKERMYLELKFGVSNCCDDYLKEYSDTEISERLGIPADDIEEFGIKALDAFTKCILATR